MIEEIITWCNSNNGFATILLSALTLLVSIIAIIVSIRTARLPYKKKLIVSGGSFISAGGIDNLKFPTSDFKYKNMCT